MAQSRKYRCRYPGTCTPDARHCYEIVAADAPEVQGRCNDDCDGEDPDWKPEAAELPASAQGALEANVAAYWEDAACGHEVMHDLGKVLVPILESPAATEAIAAAVDADYRRQRAGGKP